ncbi:MAG: GNAT family N-acetyltransferase [Fidelibacterota bacterium]
MDLTRESMQDLIQESLVDSPNIEHLFDIGRKLVSGKIDRRVIHTFLDLGHFPQVNSSVVMHNRIEDWLNLLIELIQISHYSFGHLFYNRTRRYKNNVLFREFHGTQLNIFTYDEVWNKVLTIAKALTFEETAADKPIRVGILTPNSFHGALLDMACLSYNFVNVPIPANAPDSDIEFIINQSGITHIFIGGEKQIHWNEYLQATISNLTLINFNSSHWDSFISNHTKIDPMLVLKRINQVNLNSIATIMYTSGTTGEPKGIAFTQNNFIIKRFARALALPEIGSKDSFLCYLPLYHTFGRFFELQGSIFWGASYTFAQDSSFKALQNNFITIKPSVFISVPRRWTQLYNTIQSTTSADTNDNILIKNVVKKVTGGSLKWGLSAAGYLDPDIFQFFQSNDINLLSGYGMTEATGGITMTPPGDYNIDSVGLALPGIELRLSTDGELLLKGPYISKHYYGDPLVSTLKKGWFHTGDIFAEKNGHYYIHDRKKEIYKSASGQTITPQKIENMLKEFDAIESAFLVGDRMDYNTVLIYPNPKYLDAHFPDRNPDEIRSSIGALIHSVNGFLSSYERMINFAVIPRNFTIENDELTQKGTYKRKNILNRWSDIIQQLYSSDQTELNINGNRLSIPNWFFKKLEIIPQGIHLKKQYLIIKSINKRCRCTWRGNHLHLGDFIYKVNQDHIDLEELLLDPRLWIGNQQLIEFTGRLVFDLIHFKKSKELSVFDMAIKSPAQPMADTNSPLNLLNNAVLALMEHKLSGLKLINRVFDNSDNQFRRIGVAILERMIHDKNLRFSQKIFNFIIPYLDESVFLINLKILFEKLRNAKKLKTWDLDKTRLKYIHIEAILLELTSARKQNSTDSTSHHFIEMLFQLCVDIALIHPKYFSFIRHELNNWTHSSINTELSPHIKLSMEVLSERFFTMLPKQKTNGKDWEKRIQFEPSIKRDQQIYILNLFQKQSVIFSTIFVLTGGRIVDLSEIDNEGIWVSELSREDGCIQYRTLLTLMDGSAYNFIISHLPNVTKKEIDDISNRQILMSSGIENTNLLNNFITYWPEQKTIITEYDRGSDVYWYLKSRENEINNKKLRDRWDMRWLHFGWSSLQGYIDFMAKTDYKLTIKNPTIKNVIVSEFDNATHVRLIRTFKTIKVESLLEALISLYENLIISTENRFQGLNHVVKWDVIFSCILQTSGTADGLSILTKIGHELRNNEIHGLNAKVIQEYIDKVSMYGYLPKPVVFASRRFQRWMDLNKDATIQAQSEILQELYKDYKLHELHEENPVIRIRFFLLTCFLNHETHLVKELLRLSSGLFNSTMSQEEAESMIRRLIIDSNCSENDAYFLTRLIYHHVEPSDYAELILHDSGMHKHELIVKIKDKGNNLFTIRPPHKPKELALFHDLLLSFNLHANFTEEHIFLLMFSPANKQCGGIYWKIIDDQTAHLEKIALIEKYHNSGLGARLLNECLQRLKKNSVHYVTVPFMTSEFFQHHGFKTNPNFAGLVKIL